MRKTPSYIIQSVAFGDFAVIGDDLEKQSGLSGAGVGVGARLILPKFYRFVVRLDYARPIIKSDTMNWSFGFQQFF